AADASARTHFGSPERTREDLSEISGHAPSRRAIPLALGDAKGDGPPRARAKSGAGKALAPTNSRPNEDWCTSPAIRLEARAHRTNHEEHPWRRTIPRSPSPRSSR